jgi:hypothetical protein
MMLHPRSKARSALPSSSCLLSDATLHNFFFLQVGVHYLNLEYGLGGVVVG